MHNADGAVSSLFRQTRKMPFGYLQKRFPAFHHDLGAILPVTWSKSKRDMGYVSEQIQAHAGEQINRRMLYREFGHWFGRRDALQCCSPDGSLGAIASSRGPATTRSFSAMACCRRRTRDWQLSDCLCSAGWIRRCLDVKSCSLSLSLSLSRLATCGP